MRILYSSKTSAIATNFRIAEALESVSEDFLRDVVQTLSFPRHFAAEPHNNRLAAGWITEQLQSYGYHTFYQGEYANVVAFLSPLPQKIPLNPPLVKGDFSEFSPSATGEVPGFSPLATGEVSQSPPFVKGGQGGFSQTCDQDGVILIGAHYDSVPGTPGADDNASAVAALLGCAKAVAEYAETLPVCFVSFNREEDNMIGSADFVDNYLLKNGIHLCQAHILEMVGYCSHSPESQRKPLNLPVKIPDRGNFLGLIGNKHSNALIKSLLQQAKSYLPDFPVAGLQVFFGLERFFYHLLRSDHTPFWRRGLSALMWTDTANFRNPNYHRVTDTPDTLDYTFLRRVTQLLILQCLLVPQTSRLRSSLN